ncbi:MAG: toxin-antitoxin system, antitoxin component [Brevundimonas sp.]|uniref:DUF7662 domain-containing protein n=1 Tax=Brevundimonas sp. TaxID=1871086 RepID=UPI002ABAF12A|nr:toxin-antitoxin system, antitoxin component [Brevundimonas sp.]MDZ4113272.1 toxin-antitoxin system, antitoxin component [Brevundimonas sp.]
MAKYAPLTSYLRRQKQAELELTFRDIERIVGGILPKAANDARWWLAGESDTLQPQHIALAQAGFIAQPSIRSERVRFVKAMSDPG